MIADSDEDDDAKTAANDAEAAGVGGPKKQEKKSYVENRQDNGGGDEGDTESESDEDEAVPGRNLEANSAGQKEEKMNVEIETRNEVELGTRRKRSGRKATGFYAEAGTGELSMMERAAAAKAGVSIAMDLRKPSTQRHAPAICAATLSRDALCVGEELVQGRCPHRHLRAFDVRSEAQYAQHILLDEQAQAAFQEVARCNRQPDKDTIVLMNAEHVPAIEHSPAVYGSIRDACNGQVHQSVQVREICSSSHHVYRMQKRQDASKPVLGLFAVQDIPPGTVLGQYIGEVRMRGEQSSQESESESDNGGAGSLSSGGDMRKHAAMRKRVGAFSTRLPAHGDPGGAARSKSMAKMIYDVNLPGYRGDIVGCPQMYMSGQAAKNEMSERLP